MHHHRAEHWIVVTGTAEVTVGDKVILLSENHNGCRDLSRAGELGVTDAYRVMKRYCYK